MCRLAFALPAFAVASSALGVPAPSADDLAFFETHIRPALIESCLECHSEESGKRKGGLWLDRASGWAVGGDNGPAIVPGDPDKSLFMRAIRYHEPDWEMPPERKLPDTTIAKFEEWIRRGAPDPRSGAAKSKADDKGIDLEAGRKFWSYQPIGNPTAPVVKDPSWATSDIDRFVLAKLEAAGLRPAPAADRATLLRRLSYALTGLPPSPEEQAAFLADQSPQALEKVADRLIGSEAFAERWARHWLDLVRYSDTCGGGRTMPLPDAWRFRDYVVDAFRRDKGIDRLIREHLAGDRMPAANDDEKMDQMIGTGFLVMGPHVYEEQDKDQLDLDVVDEQLDTIGKAFLGQSIGCARCHDHKFDPIPTSDYYAMAGIFTSTRSIRHSNVSQWYTMPYRPTPAEAAAIAAFDREGEPLKHEIAELNRDLSRLGASLADPDANVKPVAAEKLAGIVIDNPAATLTGIWKDSTYTKPFVGDSYRTDAGQPKGSCQAVYTIQLEKAGRCEVRISWSAGPNRATDTPVTIHHVGGETVLRVNQRKQPEIDGLFHSLGVFEFAKGESKITIGGKAADGVVIADAVQLLPEGGVPAVPAPVVAEKGKKAGDAEEITRIRAELKIKNEQLAKLEKARPKLPTVMAVDDAEEPADTPLRIRGMVRSFGETVPRGFLQVAQPGGTPMTSIEAGSGRLELANWITGPENPLTARVMANRIWQHLCGEGIVGSPDNFGTTGDAPTHPELLDFLARRLISQNWSTKSLVREIVLSRTWAMSSELEDADPLATRIDRDNRLLHRAHRRKIDAEALRDSLLTFAGTLDGKSGGPALPEGFKSEYDDFAPSLRRSVYVPIFRNQIDEVFGTFDFANPNFTVGRRGESNIPTQSLFLMNSAFVHQQAELAAKRLTADKQPNSGTARVENAYRLVLGRAPTETERHLSESFVQAGGPDKPETWSALMRTLFGCVDFQYIR
jgi:hypothetical protein